MDRPGFLYLLTPQFTSLLQRDGLALDASGALSLALLPSPANPNPPQIEAIALSGPAGIGVAEDGTLYIADPANNQIVRRNSCDGQGSPLPCFGGAGNLPGQLNTPRGVLVGPRHRLYVADSGNHRIQVVDLGTLQICSVWGQPDPFALPELGDDPGRFNDPWDLAVDAQEDVYVVDHGNHRIQKFSPDGVVQPQFWQTLQAQADVQLVEPAYIAVTLIEGQERLLVSDRGDGRLKLFRTDGTFDDAATQTWSQVAITNPAGLSFTGDRLYVGDAENANIYVFDPSGSLLGVIPAPQGALYSLVLDRQGRLLVHSGASASVAQLLPGQVYASEGSFLIGPLEVGEPETRWHRLEVQGPPLPADSHVQLFTLTSMNASAPISLPPADISALEVDETPYDAWRAAPRDVLDLQILNQPERYLWVAGVLTSAGNTTPLIQQLRVEYDHESWLRYLAAIYTPPESQHHPVRFLTRALALFQSNLEYEDRLIEHLPQLFDALASPAKGAPDSWLDWLAGWLALDLPEQWGEDQKRTALQKIFQLNSKRGTVEGLKGYIELFTGATARIIEPAQAATLWRLGEDSRLGFSTALAAAEAQGAVLGTTAELGYSRLMSADEYGAPLFEDLAHEFTVQVYAADLKTDQAIARLRTLVEQEKPAHTVACVQVIGPELRVGYQATLGVDAIVAPAHPQLRLGENGQLGVDSGLAEHPDQLGMGESLWLGVNTRLA